MYLFRYFIYHFPNNIRHICGNTNIFGYTTVRRLTIFIIHSFFRLTKLPSSGMLQVVNVLSNSVSIQHLLLTLIGKQIRRLPVVLLTSAYMFANYQWINLSNLSKATLWVLRHMLNCTFNFINFNYRMKSTLSSGILKANFWLLVLTIWPLKFGRWSKIIAFTICKRIPKKSTQLNGHQQVQERRIRTWTSS